MFNRLNYVGFLGMFLFANTPFIVITKIYTNGGKAKYYGNKI